MVTNQAYLFTVFIVNGLLIGFLFDFFRILRKTIKTSDFVTYIQDFIFWILTGGLILFFTFKFNNGEIRLFLFLGIIMGITIYIVSLSNFIIKINVEIITFIKKILKIPIKITLKIYKKLFLKPISFLIINIKKSIKNLPKKVSTPKKL